MTTTAEIKQLVASYPADAQRLTLLASARLAVEEGGEDLAREMVALANRDGGRIVIGVDAAGRFEEELAVAPEAIERLVARLATELVAPPLAATVEQLAGDEGPVLVVQVPRRVAAPHAVARVGGQGRVGARAFYVRDRDRTRGVSDAQLAWMFRVVTDPAVSFATRLTLHTARGLEPAAGVPQPRAAEYFGTLAGKVGDELAATIAADDALRSDAFVELAPWALLAEVDAILSGDDTLAAEPVSLDDLPVPAHGSVFRDAPGGLRGVLGGTTGGGLLSMLRRRRSPSLTLPTRSELLVDHLSHQHKTRLVLTHPEFVLSFSARATGAGAGYAWRDGEAADGVRWVELALETECSLPFPTAADGADSAAVDFLDRLQQRLRTRWDGERLLDALAPTYLGELP